MIDDGYLREVPEEEHKDVSFLVEEWFVRFFTSTTTADWESPIMQLFRGKVLRAKGTLTAYGKYKRSQPVWRDIGNWNTYSYFFLQTLFHRLISTDWNSNSVSYHSSFLPQLDNIS
ncbi:MAG: hypothetical protein K5654_00940 [Lachnospiraceae bacterium]|nr:hypothetical protein [Lachnospiraceae bacterium]